MTSVQQAAVAVATRPIALLAIAHHVEEQRLLAPNYIDFDPALPHVLLCIDNFGSARWVDSIHVDQWVDSAAGPGWVTTWVTGRLPFGIKVCLRFLREAPAFVVVTP